MSNEKVKSTVQPSGLVLRGKPSEVMDTLKKLMEEFGEDSEMSVMLETGPNLAKTMGIIEQIQTISGSTDQTRAGAKRSLDNANRRQKMADLGRVDRFRKRLSEIGIGKFPQTDKMLKTKN